jgi:hypothetical protein
MSSNWGEINDFLTNFLCPSTPLGISGRIQGGGMWTHWEKKSGSSLMLRAWRGWVYLHGRMGR